ncbi:hypothetical protein QTP88_014050 [Uroleucon formosanum]
MQLRDILISLPGQLKLPFDVNAISLYELSKTSKLAIVYMNGTLVFELIIPLLNPVELTLYHMIPLPVRREKLYMHLTPEFEYMAISKTHEYYLTISVTHLMKCRELTSITMCPETQPLRIGSAGLPCEVELFMKPTVVPATCTVKYLELTRSIYHKLKYHNKWIYIINTLDDVAVTCDQSDNAKNIQLRGVGIFTLSEQCRAHTPQVVLTPNRHLKSVQYLDFIPPVNIPSVKIPLVPSFKFDNLLNHQTSIIKLNHISDFSKTIEELENAVQDEKNRSILQTTSGMHTKIIIILSSNLVNEEIEDNPGQINEISIDQIPSTSHDIPAPLPLTQITPVQNATLISIPALYQKCLIETKEMIVTEAISGCITTDCWTSRNNAGYIAITFHFIDNNFLLKSVLLSCHEFSDSHTSQNLSQKIKSIIQEWNLENKIIFAVSDNASNIQLALKILQIKHFGCFAHTLNLIVQGALALESDLLDKIKTIVTFFRKSTSANKKFQIYQTSNGVKVPIKLLQDVSTRWNSSLYMLDRFVVLEDCIWGTLGLLDNSPPGLTSSEWKIIKELVLVLRPFEEATKAVSGNNYITASMVIIIAQGLINVCDQLLKQNYTSRTNAVINKLLNGMKERNRWGNIENSKTLARCTFLDPRFKDVPLSQSIQQTTKTDIIQLTAAIISSESLEEQQIPNTSTATETVTENKSGFSIWCTIDT